MDHFEDYITIVVQKTDRLKERLNHLHGIDNMSWREIAKLPEFHGLPVRTIYEIARGRAVPLKYYDAFGFPPHALAPVCPKCGRVPIRHKCDCTNKPARAPVSHICIHCKWWCSPIEVNNFLWANCKNNIAMEKCDMNICYRSDYGCKFWKRKEDL